MRVRSDRRAAVDGVSRGRGCTAARLFARGRLRAALVGNACYGSLHVYCRDALGLSEGKTYNRIEVARAARRFPVILEMLAAGTVTLTAVRLLAPRLTLANHRDVLDSARGKKKAEIGEIVARLAPRSDVPASVRRLPALC